MNNNDLELELRCVFLVGYWLVQGVWQNQFLFGLQPVTSVSKRMAVFCSALTAYIIFNLNDQEV